MEPVGGKMALKLGKFRVRLLITSLVAAVLIVVANSAIWANRYFNDTDNFTRTAVTSLTSDSSTDAIASEIVDRALVDYPTVKNLVDDTAVNFISGLLGSDRMQQVMTKLVSRMQIFLTSLQREPIVVNLSGAKDTINRLIQLAGREGETRFDPDKIPDEITIIDPSKYPNFYQAGVTLMWLSPILVIGAAILLAWPYLSDRSRYREILAFQGGALVLAGLLALLLGPLFRPMVLGNIQSANLRVVVGNLYNAFIETYTSQTMFLIVLGLLTLAISASLVIARHYRAKPRRKK